MIPGRCQERVSDSTGWHRYQCTRKAVRDGYCTQHHPDSVEARRVRSRERWEQQVADDARHREESAVRLLREKGYTVYPPCEAP